MRTLHGAQSFAGALEGELVGAAGVVTGGAAAGAGGVVDGLEAALPLDIAAGASTGTFGAAAPPDDAVLVALAGVAGAARAAVPAIASFDAVPEPFPPQAAHKHAQMNTLRPMRRAPARLSIFMASSSEQIDTKKYQYVGPVSKRTGFAEI